MCSTVTQADYRATIGLFATGVTVLLTEKDGDVRGMTANAVASLSLDPALLIVCVSKTAKFAEYIEISQRFTLNVLGEDQESLSDYFASRRKGDLPWSPRVVCWPELEVPRLETCLSAVACEVSEVHHGGDHWIVIGEVRGLHKDRSPRRPLLFFGGDYHRLYADVDEFRNAEDLGRRGRLRETLLLREPSKRH